MYKHIAALFSREPRLYKSVCPAVGRSVGRSVRRMVHRSVTSYFFGLLGATYTVYTAVFLSSFRVVVVDSNDNCCGSVSRGPRLVALQLVVMVILDW